MTKEMNQTKLYKLLEKRDQVLFYVNAPIYEVILFELTGNTPIFTSGKVELQYK